jgi:hypothetical protein
MKRKPRGFLLWVRVGGAVPEGGRRRGCDGGSDLLSMTRGSRWGETKVGAALDAVESGRGVGAFYRVGEEGRQPIGGARRWAESAL